MPLKQVGPGGRVESVAVEKAIQRVYLTGFMGAGKSTVGALLARRMGWSFLDLDAVIETNIGHSVSHLFDTHGEAHFRLLELETLRAIRSKSKTVISLGGGAIETAEVRALLAGDEHGVLIFLEAPLERLLDRCAAQDGSATRPLLRDIALLQSRYEIRLAHYKKAHLTVATQEISPEEVAATILNHLAARKTWK
jgi:shikimate kinase